MPSGCSLRKLPLFVLLLEATLRQRRSLVEWVTAALVTGGCARLPNSAGRIASSGTLVGIVRALLRAVAVGNRALAARHSASAIAFWQNACARVPAAARRSHGGGSGCARHPAPRRLGVVCTAFAHTFFIRSLLALSAHTASVVAALEPVYGIALALLLLGEIPPARTLAGAVLIIGAALYATWRSGRGIRRLR